MAEWIVDILRRKGDLTVLELCSAVGITEDWYYKLQRGEGSGSQLLRMKLGSVLGVPAHQITFPAEVSRTQRDDARKDTPNEGGRG